MRRAHIARVIALALLLVVSTETRSIAHEPRAQSHQVGLDTQRLKRAGQLFQQAVDKRQIAGAVLLVAHQGKIAYLDAVGKQDVDADIPMTPQSIFRIASMTKPITSVAVMMLAEQGKLDLSDPVSLFLPEFKFMKVAMARSRVDAKAAGTNPGEPREKPSVGRDADFEIVPAYRPITIRDLLTHTSGLCYRFRNLPHVGRLYADAGICDGISPSDHTLGENVRRLASLPLAHQPGTAWEYGLSTDVLGRLVEVVSGKSLAAFFQERIFAPLGMNDTHFVLPESKRGRLAALYEPDSGGSIVRTGEGLTTKGALIYSASLPYAGTKNYFSGGAGLVSTASDYARFLQMLLNRGQIDGTRLLRPETVDAMTRNQTGGLALWIPVHGLGFGYGCGVTTRPDSRSEDPVGTFGWGGIYYTDFWVDPSHGLIGIMMTQIYPSAGLKLRDEFHRLVNESLRSRPN
ncbi:MAG: serine hydrolase domain-containing protein [Isosphaeraceae bacterium]